MSAAALALWLSLAAAPRIELYPVEKLSLIPRAELRVHLHDLDDELYELRQPLTSDQVLAQAADRTSPFLLASTLPLIAAGLVFGKFNVPATVLVFGAAPLAIALVAALVYCIGSVIEFLLVGEPERIERERLLTAYRPRVVAELAARNDAPLRSP